MANIVNDKEKKLAFGLFLKNQKAAYLSKKAFEKLKISQ